MSDHNVDTKAEVFFEDLWKSGDPWKLQTSPFERAKYEQQLEMLRGRRYRRVLEIGCGNGCFTTQLADIADYVLALDIAPSAIERARAASIGKTVECRVANIMHCDLRAEGSWDLVVMSETIYYLGWLYPFFDVAWLASEIFAATQQNGRLLMANTCGGVEDYLLLPWMIRSYHDLFVHIGSRRDCEQLFDGRKDAVGIEVLISLFAKAEKA
jgi:SAM-dependent methyltransferase